MYFLLVASLWNADRQTSSQGHLHKWCQVVVKKLGLMANLLKRRFYSVHIPYRERPLFPSYGFVRQAESRGRFLQSGGWAKCGQRDKNYQGLRWNYKWLGWTQILKTSAYYKAQKTFSANVSREHQAGEMLREGKFSTALSFRQEMGSGWGRRRDPARSPEGLSLWNLNNCSM